MTLEAKKKTQKLFTNLFSVKIREMMLKVRDRIEKKQDRMIRKVVSL